MLGEFFSKESLLEKTYTYTVFKTRLGYMGIVKTLLGLHTVILPKADSEEVMRQLKKSFQSNLVKDDKSLKNIRDKFLDYFSGKPVRFDEILDLSDATDFENWVNPERFFERFFNSNILLMAPCINLEKISRFRVKFIALPLKIKGSAICPTRAVVVEE